MKTVPGPGKSQKSDQNFCSYPDCIPIQNIVFLAFWSPTLFRDRKINENLLKTNENLFKSNENLLKTNENL